MQMSENEIKRNYLMARDRKNQISVLADLNLCTNEEIISILVRNGVPETEFHFKKDGRGRWTKKEKPKEEGKPPGGKKVIPGIVKEVLKKEISNIMEELEDIAERQNELTKREGELTGKYRMIRAYLSEEKEGCGMDEANRGSGGAFLQEGRNMLYSKDAPEEGELQQDTGFLEDKQG